MPLSLKAAQSPDCCLPSGKGSVFDSAVFNTDADSRGRELAAAGKNNPTRSFYLCFPNTSQTPTLALVTVHCRDIQASQELRALAACPHVSTSSPVAGEGGRATIPTLCVVCEMKFLPQLHCSTALSTETEAAIPQH